jgi:hypothetical protein
MTRHYRDDAHGFWSAFGRVTLATAFASAPRLAFALEVSGLEHARAQPSTYLAISHKRDFDTMAPVARIMFSRGWASLTREVRFAMRSDSFEPGFLARVVTGPRWFLELLRLVRPFSVGPILRGLGVYPLTDYSQRPGETWIREHLRVVGDAPVSETLAPWMIQTLAEAAGDDPDAVARLPLSGLLAWRFHAPLQPRVGPAIFTGRARRQAERRVVGIAKAELAALANWLRRGGSLTGSPEGRLSPDGRLSPITSGLHRVLRAAPEETRLTPIMIVYDFMTTHHRRMFVDLAPSIEHAPRIPQRALEEALRRAWMRAARFTCSQLGTAFLIQRAQSDADAPFTLEELAGAVCEQAQTLTEQVRHVDRRLLTERGAHERARGFLAFVARHGYVRRMGHNRWLATPGDLHVDVPLWDVGYRQFPLGYAWNEYNEMIAAGERASLAGAG